MNADFHRAHLIRTLHQTCMVDGQRADFFAIAARLILETDGKHLTLDREVSVKTLTEWGMCSISRVQKIRKDPLFRALFEVVNGSGVERKQPHFRTNAHRLHAALGLEMANV